jgi:L-amino acid N-acyltransferase YncA
MTEILIRQSKTSDIAAITRIYEDAVLHSCASWEWTAPNEVEMEKRRDEILAKGYPFIVAEKEGVVVAYAYVGAFRDRAAYAPLVENSIYVDRANRYQGIGRALLKELIRVCEEMGYRQMIAMIGDDEKASSIALHEACGFKVTGSLPGAGWKHGHWMELVMMVRPLGEGVETAPVIVSLNSRRKNKN